MNLGLIIIVELILVALLADFPFTCISAECRLVEASTVRSIRKKELSRVPLFLAVSKDSS